MGPHLDDLLQQVQQGLAGLLAQLQAVTDPAQLETKFDELMNANSEDTGLAANPDGYTFTAGEMVEPFETATRALSPGQISDIVESDYGYHIILRLDPSQVEDVRYKWESSHLTELTQQWVEEAEIETTETYDQLSAKDFYEKLTAYRATLNEESASDTTESTDTQSGTEGTDTQTDAQSGTEGTDAQTDAQSGTEGTDTQTDAQTDTEGTDAAQTDGTDAAAGDTTDGQTGTDTGADGTTETPAQ